MRIHFFTPAEVQAASDRIRLARHSNWEAWAPQAPIGEADSYVLETPPGELRRGDIKALALHYGISPRQIILLDIVNADEIDLPFEAKDCLVARAHFRAGERARYRILPMPPVSAFWQEPKQAEWFDYDVSFLTNKKTGAETAAFNSIKDLAIRQSPRNMAYTFHPAVEGIRSEVYERGEDGKCKVKPGLHNDSREVLRVAQEVERIGGPLGSASRPFLADARIVESQEWPFDESLRQSVTRSRAVVAVQLFDRGSISRRAVEAASLGRMCFLIGSVGALPFGRDCSDWLFEIPFDKAQHAGPLIFEKLKTMTDEDVRAAGRAARAWHSQVCDIPRWPALLAEANK
jgi:hypothetical protein